jgi:hypothetical protein
VFESGAQRVHDITDRVQADETSVSDLLLDRRAVLDDREMTNSIFRQISIAYSMSLSAMPR